LALKMAQKFRFWAPQARGWAETKIFWVVPGGGLGVYKSTPEFGSLGYQGAVRSQFQFYLINLTPNLELGVTQPLGAGGQKFFGSRLPPGGLTKCTIRHQKSRFDL